MNHVSGMPSGGARFYRCALQVNPHHYAHTYRGQITQRDALSHATEIVHRATELGIDVLAITDHNNVDGITAFRSASRDQPVHIFPGFELSSSEGIHVLCVYPVDTSDERLGRYLGSFGILDTSPSSTLANKTFSQILEGVHNQGGIAIAAHVTNASGLFKVLSAQARIRAWRDENLLAAQIPGPIEDLPQAIRPIFMNRNSEYRRAQAPEEGLAIAAVNAKDVVHADDLDAPSATCWIKMQEVTIDGLRQAFLDPGSRVRLNPREGTFAPDKREDDLDNRFITEGIVPRMREERQRRQFIFSTHNANIPVLGDAELIVGLSAAGDADTGRARIAPEHTGSIDSRSVRELKVSFGWPATNCSRRFSATTATSSVTAWGFGTGSSNQCGITTERSRTSSRKMTASSSGSGRSRSTHSGRMLQDDGARIR